MGRVAAFLTPRVLPGMASAPSPLSSPRGDSDAAKRARITGKIARQPLGSGEPSSHDARGVHVPESVKKQLTLDVWGVWKHTVP